MTGPGFCVYPPAHPAPTWHPAPPSRRWDAYLVLAPSLPVLVETRGVRAAAAAVRNAAKDPR